MVGIGIIVCTADSWPFLFCHPARGGGGGRAKNSSELGV